MEDEGAVVINFYPFSKKGGGGGREEIQEGGFSWGECRPRKDSLMFLSFH